MTPAWHKLVINARVPDICFLTNNFADFLYSAGKNNQDFVQSLVAFWISTQNSKYKLEAYRLY